MIIIERKNVKAGLFYYIFLHKISPNNFKQSPNNSSWPVCFHPDYYTF